MRRWLLTVALLAACGEVDRTVDTMDAGESMLADASGSDSAVDGDVFDKENGAVGWPTRWPNPSDYTMLPLAVKMVPLDYDGWRTTSSIWLYELCGVGPCPNGLWGRASGNSWYRARTLSPTHSLYYVAPVGYVCTPQFFGAVCAGQGRYIDLSCPPRLQWSEFPSEWRSRELPWPADQEGWFLGAFVFPYKWKMFNSDIHMNPIGVTTTPDRRQVHCNYRTLEPGAWPFIDTWTQNR